MTHENYKRTSTTTTEGATTTTTESSSTSTRVRALARETLLQMNLDSIR